MVGFATFGPLPRDLGTPHVHEFLRANPPYLKNIVIYTISDFAYIHYLKNVNETLVGTIFSYRDISEDQSRLISWNAKT